MSNSTYKRPIALLWNRYACDALYLTNTPPTIGSRMLAILHTAMYDAMVVYLSPKEMPTSSELQKIKEVPCDYNAENRQEAYSYAAYRVLTCEPLYSSDLTIEFKTELKQFFSKLGYDPNNQSVDPSTPAGVGNLAAKLILASREKDGSNQEHRYIDNSNYQPVNPAPPELPKEIDRWQPQLVDNKPQSFLTPHWGQVKPFALQSGDECRPQDPIAECDPGFKEQGNYLTEVSANLTDTQKMIAEFWAGMHEDLFEGLPTKEEYEQWIPPPPQCCRIAREMIIDRELHAVPAIILLFAVTNALMDAGIAAWDSKRHYDYVRPVTLINRLRDNEKFRSWGGPGRGTVEMEGEGWQPYIPTPPFAEYVSGHSTFSAAMAEIVKCFFGEGRYRKQVCIPAGSSKIEGECDPPLPAEDVVLSWKTIDEVADQAGMSTHLWRDSFYRWRYSRQRTGPTGSYESLAQGLHLS